MEQAIWRQGPKVSEIGEFSLIREIRGWIASVSEGRDEIITGLGDDTAILRPPSGWDLVWSCDIQAINRHFRSDLMTPRQVGARAVEVNLSDIAAMGGEPIAALISLGLPADLPVAALEEIYRGFISACGPYRLQIVGGNISQSSDLFIDISILGRVESGRALRRNAAAYGDIVFVTGFPGRAGAAISLFDSHTNVSAQLRDGLNLSYTSPKARITAGRYLVENQIKCAVIDTSDGITGDLCRICEESGVGIELDGSSFPADPLLMQLGDVMKTDPLDWFLGASDDYELLITASESEADRILTISRLLSSDGYQSPGGRHVPVTPIGRVLPGDPVIQIQDSQGGSRKLTGGWDHLI